MNTPRAADTVTEKAPNQATEPVDSRTPRAAWPEILRDATREVFSSMVGVSLDASSPTNGEPVHSEAAKPPRVPHVTGMIGIAGAVRAVFSLCCTDRAAIGIASQMLALSPEEAAAQKSDAVGEVCNMIAGHFKHKIGHGDSCTLTIPTVVAGGSYTIHYLEKGERLAFPVNYEGETLLVTLDIRG